MKAVALDTLQFQEYQTPNWIEGNKYEAHDDGTVLTVSSEQNTNFRLMGEVRKFMLTQFKFEDGVSGEAQAR